MWKLCWVSSLLSLTLASSRRRRTPRFCKPPTSSDLSNSTKSTCSSRLETSRKAKSWMRKSRTISVKLSLTPLTSPQHMRQVSASSRKCLRTLPSPSMKMTRRTHKQVVSRCRYGRLASLTSTISLCFVSKCGNKSTWRPRSTASRRKAFWQSQWKIRWLLSTKSGKRSQSSER